MAEPARQQPELTEEEQWAIWEKEDGMSSHERREFQTELGAAYDEAREAQRLGLLVDAPILRWPASPPTHGAPPARTTVQSECQAPTVGACSELVDTWQGAASRVLASRVHPG